MYAVVYYALFTVAIRALDLATPGRTPRNAEVDGSLTRAAQTARALASRRTAVRDLLLTAVLAAVWWIPTFIALTDLWGREHLPRTVVWRWTAVLCTPVVGAARYRRRGRSRLG